MPLAPILIGIGAAAKTVSSMLPDEQKREQRVSYTPGNRLAGYVPGEVGINKRKQTFISYERPQAAKTLNKVAAVAGLAGSVAGLTGIGSNGLGKVAATTEQATPITPGSFSLEPEAYVDDIPFDTAKVAREYRSRNPVIGAQTEMVGEIARWFHPGIPEGERDYSGLSRKEARFQRQVDQDFPSGRPYSLSTTLPTQRVTGLEQRGREMPSIENRTTSTPAQYKDPEIESILNYSPSLEPEQRFPDNFPRPKVDRPVQQPVAQSEDKWNWHYMTAPKKYNAWLNQYGTKHGTNPWLGSVILALESGFGQKVTNDQSSATGVTQFIRSTGEQVGRELYGDQFNFDTDMLDPEKSIEMTMYHLAQLGKKMGTTDAAALLAAYHGGIGAYQESGGDISKMSPETQQYVRRAGRYFKRKT